MSLPPVAGLDARSVGNGARRGRTGAVSRAVPVGLVIALLLSGLAGAAPPRPSGNYPSGGIATSGPGPAAPLRSAFLGPPGALNGTALLDAVPTENDPSSAAWDSRTGDVYVTNFGALALGGNTVTVFDGANDSVLATLPVGDDPLTSTYDPADGFDYVMNYGVSNNVSVLDGTSEHATINVGVSPSNGVYDPADGDVYVANSKSANVSIVNGTRVVATVAVGADPGVLSYDPVHQLVYVPNAGSNNVSVLNGTHLVATLGVGASPGAGVYDPSTEVEYILNPGSDNATLINATTVVGWVAAGSVPTLGGYDPTDREVLIADDGSGSVDALRGTGLVANISVGGDPRNIVFDPSNGLVYIPCWTSNDVYILNGTEVAAVVEVGTSPYGAAFDPGNSAIYVMNFNDGNVSHLGTPTGAFGVTFRATGLPPGTDWTFRVNATTYRVAGAQLLLPLPDARYTYWAPPIHGFQPTNASGNFSVAGGPTTVTIPFVATYPIDFVAQGLAPGTFWNVSIGPYFNASTNTTLTVAEPNGSFTYDVTPVAGYTANRSGPVDVDAHSASVDIAFHRLFYPVDFQESGLVLGTNWSVTLAGGSNASTTHQVGFEETNGSFAYSVPSVSGYRESPAAGDVYVRGRMVIVPVRFDPVYTVRFEATGLPNGTAWTVRIGADRQTTLGTSIAFSEIAGRFTYVVNTSTSHYAPAPAIGNVTVGAATVNVSVPFLPTQAPPTYFLQFQESGLPFGGPWTVTLTGPGSTQFYNSSLGSLLGFLLPNGTYSYRASAPGFLASPTTGNATVDGPGSISTTISIGFAPAARAAPKFTVTFTETGLPAGTDWSVFVNNGTTGSDGAAVLSVPLANGTYTFTLSAPSGYHSGGGRFTVHGPGGLVPIDFATLRYAVVFQETGLPAGTTWNVTAGPFSNESTTGEVTLWLSNGSYWATATTPAAGYTVATYDPVVVSGGLVAPAVGPAGFVFGHPASSSTPATFGLSGNDGPVLLGVLVLEAIAVVIFLWRRRSGSAPLAPTEILPPPRWTSVDDPSDPRSPESDEPPE